MHGRIEYVNIRLGASDFLQPLLLLLRHVQIAHITTLLLLGRQRGARRHRRRARQTYLLKMIIYATNLSKEGELRRPAQYFNNMDNSAASANLLGLRYEFHSDKLLWQ